MTTLGVVGNLSRDTAVHPATTRHLLGGAALHIALAATRAGLRAAPIAVIGPDLTGALTLPAIAELDLADIRIASEPSCRFRLRYDTQGVLLDLRATYGAARELTEHALQAAARYPHVHVCCRRPLDAHRMLDALAGRGQRFSVDFITSSATEIISAVADLLPSASIIFTNASEFEPLTQTVALDRLHTVTVTDGPRPVVVYRNGIPLARLAVAAATAVEVTGAGDTFTGTFLGAILLGQPEPAALALAVNAATGHITTAGIPLDPNPKTAPPRPPPLPQGASGCSTSRTAFSPPTTATSAPSAPQRSPSAPAPAGYSYRSATPTRKT